MWGEATIDRHRHPAANDSQALGCHHRFAGQYYDEESELHYNRFRYYSPETGQYLSHDPIGLLGGFNPYGYVFDPTGWVDVLGLKPKIPPFDALSLESDVVMYKPRDVLTATAGSREDAINLAWSQEKQLIQQTGRGTRPWTPEEMALITSTPDSELLSVMSKEGYTGHHITSVRNGPLGAKWQGNPRNIVFLENRNHSNGDAHQYSYQGHRGNYSNPTTGRLIDREETLKQRLNQIQSKCTG